MTDLQQKRELLDQLSETMRLLMLEICVAVLNKCGHHIENDDVVAMRAGEGMCEVICEQGSFIIDRATESIINFTPNPDYIIPSKEVH